MQESKSNQARAKVGGRRPRILGKGIAIVGTAGLAAAVLLPSGTALAAYQAGPSPDGSSTGSVTVTSAISLVDNTATIFLGSGAPGDSLTGSAAPATMTVYTNNATGYNVTVQAATDLTDAAVTTDTIPATDLSVEDLATTDTNNTASDSGGFVALPTAADVLVGTPPTAAPPLIVYDQATRSAIGTVSLTTGAITGGDTLHENWEFNTALPDVNAPGTYSTILNFVAAVNVTP
ncbi:MAG: hypothetical protein ABSF03_16730 [Streptosporangiaceae bacterium]|jgi:Tfp pilus assembly major pilin PilA